MPDQAHDAVAELRHALAINAAIPQELVNNQGTREYWRVGIFWPSGRISVSVGEALDLANKALGNWSLPGAVEPVSHQTGDAQKDKLSIEGLDLILTCGACPEQYDVLDGHGQTVGYLRLRGGWFRADVPDCGGETVYDAYPKGDGQFDDDERMYFLTEAVRAIKARMKDDPADKESAHEG